MNRTAMEPTATLKRRLCGCLLLALALIAANDAPAATSVLVGWSEYGLWETDGRDVSVFSLAPPYSTIHAQLMTNGVLVTNGSGFTVTYEAVADATGSINRTSVGKGNFHQFAEALLGVPLAPDQGLAGFRMPGPANQPQPMTFEPGQHQFSARGIPLTPYDDAGRTNHLPLLKLVARDQAGAILASTQIAVPVADTMDCRSCHGSGSIVDGRPPSGWAWDTDPVRDYKLNVLRSHDGHQLGTSTYAAALAKAGYDPAGLEATVVQRGQPVNCLRCHGSNAIPGSGDPERKPLTEVMHAKHAYSRDPERALPLITLNDSAACLRCHAGPDTLRLRGVHHNRINPNGSPTLQCTSCHGNMTALGSAQREGWLDQPTCQSCHTGTATSNNGEIRYTNVIDAATGLIRQPVNTTFATEPDVPSVGRSLFKLSHGHGGLNCQACHGSTHAELGSAQRNDNVQSQLLQGQAGRLADCNACHTTVPQVINGGPHGLHPMDDRWATHHETGNNNACKDCHGSTFRGSVLSAMLDTRSFGGDLRGLTLWQGNQVGCYNCHTGPNDDDGNGVTPAVASSGAATTTQETPVTITLSASGSGLTYRAASPPAQGTVVVSGNVATYFPATGFVGTDSFTFAANNGSVDSNRATITVTVTPGDCSLTARALVPYAALPGSPVPFRAGAALTQCAGPVSFMWDFGDGSAPMTGANVAHVYALPGDYTWSVTATANGASHAVSGVVTISATLGPPLELTIAPLDPWTLQVTWPADRIPGGLEYSSDLSAPHGWNRVHEEPTLDEAGSFWTVPVDLVDGTYFWRVRRLP